MADEPIDAATPADALRKQLESDVGPHPTPDQERAAAKRRAAAGIADDDQDDNAAGKDARRRSTPPVARTRGKKHTA